MKLVFLQENTLGRHKVDVTAIGSNGLMQRKTHRLTSYRPLIMIAKARQAI